MKQTVQLILWLTLWGLATFSSSAQIKSFTVDYGITTGTIKPFRQVNIGPGKSVKGYQEIGITEIRTHDYYGPCDYWTYTVNYYNVGTGSFNPAYNPHLTTSYNWLKSDQKIDSIVQFGFTPFFRLGISYPQSNTPLLPPIDADGSFKTFAAVCRRTAMHYTQGWGNGYQHDIKYWEIWNEPDLGNLFWKGENATPINYHKMYKAVSDSVKSVNSAFKVGGPGLSFAGSVFHVKGYYDHFISYCANNNAKLDFFSWHLYDCKNPYSIKNYADTVRQTLDRSGFINAESIITEINPDLKDDTYNDTPKGAAYTASMFLVCNEAAVDKLFWYRGVQLGRLVNEDAGGQPDLTWNGTAFKAYKMLAVDCPVKISSTGNEVVNTVRNDTTSVMMLAGRSNSGNLITLLLSNLNSTYSNLSINVRNVPWNGQSNLNITEIRPGRKFVNTQSKATITGNAVTVLLPNAAAPAVFLVRIGAPDPVYTEFGQEKKVEIKIYPNPAEDMVTIRFTGYEDIQGFSAELTDPGGRIVYKKPIINPLTNLDLNSMPGSGVYFLNITDRNRIILKSERLVLR